MLRITFTIFLLALVVLGKSQDARLPRTIKFYPLSLVRGELLLGYEHGLRQRFSISGQMGFHGSGLYSQVQDNSGASADCNTIWPAKGFSFKVGPRFYPSKLKRQAPFYIELLLSYRRTKYLSIREYMSAPCDPALTLHKQINPLVQRWGLHTILGGALRRDRRFTLDLYGGLGLNILFINEMQEMDNGNPDPFFRVEPSRSRFQPSAHLGLTIGYNLNGTRRN